MIANVIRRAGWPVLIVLIVAGVFYVGAFPVRTYFDQRQSIRSGEARLAELHSRNDELQSRMDRLSDDREIERLAREQYGLAKPGEEVYHVLPRPEDPVRSPQAWPFRHLAERLGDTEAPTGATAADTADTADTANP